MLKTLQLTFVYCLVSLSWQAFSEKPNTNIQAGLQETFAFEKLVHGLSQSTVTAIEQDYKGYLWFGTSHGLNRYDGVGFTIYEHEVGDSTSLGNSTVRCIFEDSKQNLWIGTYGGGLNRYDRAQDRFIRYEAKPGTPGTLSDNAVNAIFEDSDSVLWIGTESGGLNRFDYQSGQFEVFKHTPENVHSLSNNYVNALSETDDGLLVVGTWGGGVNLMDRNTKQFTRFTHDPNNPGSISDNVVTTIFKGPTGKVWIGTHKGINLLVKGFAGRFSFDRQLSDVLNFEQPAPTTILSIREDTRGRLWVGTENEGLYICYPLSGYFRHHVYQPGGNQGISSNSIWSIFEDKVGTIWLGTFNKGLNKLDPYQRKFEHYLQNPYHKNSLSHNIVSCFTEDNSGNIWVGTDGGGLNQFDRKNGTFRAFEYQPNAPSSLSNNAVIAAITDSKGQLWFGTWGGGINLYNPATEQFSHWVHLPGQPNSISGDNIADIFEDKQKRIWIAAFRSGVDVYDRNTGQFTHLIHQKGSNTTISSNSARVITQDHNGNIWIGTEGGGLNKIAYTDSLHYTVTVYRHSQSEQGSISNDIVISLYEDKHQNLWIGTQDGLNLYNAENDNFTQYRVEDGLPGNLIYGIQEDGQGNLWLSTNQGIARYNIRKNEVKTYHVADGLQASEFVKGAYYKSSKGELYFGGVNGFNVFHPAAVQENPHAPKVYITGIKIFNKTVNPSEKRGAILKAHITETAKLVLPHDENVFSFKFAALNYSQPSRNQFAYKLEGYDDNWHEIGTRNTAYYTKVPPGNYVFRVMGSNNDGVWNRQGTSIDIKITPPWWATMWAYALYTIAVMGMLLWTRQAIINRERLKSNLKLEHMELMKMQEMDQIKSRFFANISHEFRTPLTLILGPLRQMQHGEFEGDPKNQFRVMARNAERLLRLINQLLDLSKLGAGSMKLQVEHGDIIRYLKPLVGSFGSFSSKQCINYEYNYAEKGIMAYFDKQKLEQIVINLLSNAFKFTPENGKIIFTIAPGHSHTEGVVITVKDSGIGIPNTELSHIFDRFYQVDSRHSSFQQGTGIGLSVTKELVELHHGNIKVESKEGTGTTFTVWLPTSRDSYTASEIVAQNQVDDSQAPMLENVESIVDKKRPVERTNINGETHEDNKFEELPIILIVEDNSDLRAYICEYLEPNYRLLEADEGQKAFDLAVKHVPDLIISDLMMPGMNGLELCNKIKTEEKTSHIPFLMITAKAGVEDKMAGYETGADYYITKPFNSKLLELSIRNIIKSREVLRKQMEDAKPFQLAPKNVKLTSADETFLTKALECVEKHISNSEFTVEHFNKEMGMSRMQSYRKLKALTGKSVNEFIRSMRLKRAAQLIQQKQLTIAEVTYEVGFNDLQYFRHCFKKQFGVNPSEYQGENPTDKVTSNAK